MAIIRINPGVQQANYRPYPVRARTVKRVAWELFKDNPMLVYSGVNRPFEENRRIGKSKSCEQIFLSILRRGFRAEYRDIKQVLRMDNRPSSRLDLEGFNYEMIESLPAADFYILDEAHQAWPRAADVTGKGPWGIPIFRGQEYNDGMLGFWRKLEGLKQAGSKFLMVTALHPQQAEYFDFLLDTEIPAMAEFFAAPVLELTDTYGD